MSRLSIDHWGPAAWTFLHAIAFSYANQPSRRDRQIMYAYITAFATVIPCKRCRDHFLEMVKRDLPNASSSHLDSRQAVSKLTVDWHNQVNMRLGKRVVAFEHVAAAHRPASPPGGGVQKTMVIVGAAAAGAIAVAVVHAIVARQRQCTTRFRAPVC